MKRALERARYEFSRELRLETENATRVSRAGEVNSTRKKRGSNGKGKEICGP
jgi:hypothetical protein